MPETTDKQVANNPRAPNDAARHLGSSLPLVIERKPPHLNSPMRSAVPHSKAFRDWLGCHARFTQEVCHPSDFVWAEAVWYKKLISFIDLAYVLMCLLRVGTLARGRMAFVLRYGVAREGSTELLRWLPILLPYLAVEIHVQQFHRACDEVSL